jgi:hypothetical protein
VLLDSDTYDPGLLRDQGVPVATGLMEALQIGVLAMTDRSEAVRG